MQPIGPDQQVELFMRAIRQRDRHPLPAFLISSNGDAKTRIDALARIKDRSGQIAAGDAEIIASCDLHENAGVDGGGPHSAQRVGFEPFDDVAVLAQAWDQPHLPGDAIARAPEVDDIAAVTKPLGAFEQYRLMTVFPQPPGQRRPGNTAAVNRDTHPQSPAVLDVISCFGTAPGSSVNTPSTPAFLSAAKAAAKSPVPLGLLPRRSIGGRKAFSLRKVHA